MQRILILRGGALGDFIVTLPAIAALRQRWPGARVELVGNPAAAALALHRGLLDAVHSQHEGRWAALFQLEPLTAALREWLGGFDLVLSYWPDPDGSLRRHLPVHDRQRFVASPALPTQAPAAAHYASPLHALGIATAKSWYRITPAASVGEPSAPGAAAAERVAVSAGQSRAPGERIAVHPGSGSPRKNWPADRWRAVLDRIGEPALLVLGEAERAAWNAAPAGEPGTKIRTATALPLEQLVQELHACRLFLGHDSGISHLAAACGVPCILLFGPTDPRMWAPPAPHVRVLQRGADLAAISVDEVMAAVRSSKRPRGDRA